MSLEPNDFGESTAAWNPKYRKRKKFVGAAVDESMMDKAGALRPQLDSGYFCKAERKWVKFKDCEYSYPDASMREVWCRCGSLIRTEMIGLK